MIRVISSFADGPVNFNPTGPDSKVNFEHWYLVYHSAGNIDILSTEVWPNS